MPDRNQLARRALSLLGIVGGGQSPNAEDMAVALDAIDGKIADLADRDIVYIADVDDFEVVFLEYVAMCLAQAIAPEFEKQMDATAIDFAERRLRQITATKGPYMPVRAEYF